MPHTGQFLPVLIFDSQKQLHYLFLKACIISEDWFRFTDRSVFTLQWALEIGSKNFSFISKQFIFDTYS